MCWQLALRILHPAHCLGPQRYIHAPAISARVSVRYAEMPYARAGKMHQTVRMIAEQPQPAAWAAFGETYARYWLIELWEAPASPGRGLGSQTTVLDGIRYHPVTRTNHAVIMGERSLIISRFEIRTGKFFMLTHGQRYRILKQNRNIISFGLMAQK